MARRLHAHSLFQRSVIDELAHEPHRFGNIPADSVLGVGREANRELSALQLDVNPFEIQFRQADFAHAAVEGGHIVSNFVKHGRKPRLH